MKLLIIADIHGEHTLLPKIIEEGMKERPDVIICPGNLTDMFRVPSEFTQLDIAELILQQLSSTHLPLLCVPGNHDPYETLELFEEYGVNLHATRKMVHNMSFIGFGGAQTPFNTLFEPSEEEVKDALSRLTGDVLVVHNPPKNTTLDTITTGEHVGSPAVREAILTNHPRLVITAHIHEAAGKDTLGETILFNPGPALHGHYGIVTIEKKGIVCVRRRVGKK